MDYTTNAAGNQPPTMASLAEMDCVTLTADTVGKVLGCNPHSIRVMARTEEGRHELGFPVFRLGTDTRIPRVPFLRYMGWEGRINGSTEVIA